MTKKEAGRKRPAPSEKHYGRLRVLVALTAIGAVLSLWLLWIHFLLAADPGADSACNFGGYLNCDVVNASRYATVLGVPVAYFGLAFYLLLGGMALFELRGGLPRALGWARGLGVLAIAYSIYLALISAVVLQAFCLFCVALYAVNLAIAALGFWRPPSPRPRFLQVGDRDLKLLREPRRAWPAWAGLALILVGAVALGLASDAVRSERPVARQIQVGERTLSTAPGHSEGPEDAAVTVVEFSDFECPYCRRASETFNELRTMFAGRVRFVFKHYPLDPACNRATPRGGHARACDAAVASVCAGRQDRFWPFHEEVFARGADEAALVAAAGSVGLDLGQWRQCRFGEEAPESVSADIEDAIRLGVDGTPTFLVGDRLVVGARPLEELAAEIRRALGEG